MKRLDERQKIRPTVESSKYLDRLKKDRIFTNKADAYAFAAAYAISHGLETKPLTSKRSDMAPFSTIPRQVRLALEAGLHEVDQQYRRDKLDYDLNTRFHEFAESGLELLIRDWHERTAGQIRQDITLKLNA